MYSQNPAVMAQRIPIFKDDLSFEERQGKVWSNMERDLERRRQEWENEIERMRKDFFTLKPEQGKLENISDKFKMDNVNDARGVIEKDQNGLPVFRVRFNVHEYKPEEVNVKMDTNKVIVFAKHEEKGENKSVSREYSREVDIPRDVDPMALQCTMSTDGVLTVEAPLPAPQYQAVKEAPRQQRIMQTQSSTSSSRSTPPPVAQPQAQQQPTTQPFHSSTFTTFLSGSQGQQPKPTTVQQVSPPPMASTSAPPLNTAPVMTQIGTTGFASGNTGSEVRSQNGDRKFKVEVDIEDFKPEDLQVKTVDKRLIITAKKEERIGSRTSTKELNREFHLPEAVDPYSVKAYFSDSGKLLIEAPYVRSVPISHYGEAREGSPHFYGGSPLTGR